MGTNSYAQVVLGFRVERADFLQEIDGPVDCGNGHRQDEGKKFCAECGCPFASRKRTIGTWTSRALARHMGWGTEDPDWATEAWDRLQGMRPIGAYQVDNVIRNHSYGVDLLAIGVRLAEQGDYHWGDPVTNAIPYKQIQDTYRHVEATRDALGMSVRPIQLFTSMRRF